jgi:diguanylate cyclase (GGDEF)-like protein
LHKQSPKPERLFLSKTVIGRREASYAWAAVLLSALGFIAIAPYATMALPQVQAFIPAYESAMIVCDLITAVLLFGQSNFFRARELLVLASGYLFTALIAFVHALTFPGVFAPSGLLGGGSQSTAWLYIFWHVVFPLCVTAYSLLSKSTSSLRRGLDRGEMSKHHPGAAALGAIAAVIALVGACSYVAIAHGNVLPALILNGHFTPALSMAVWGILALTVVALVTLWRRRPRTIIDLWLMVVMCVWLFDIALSAGLNEARFDVGWYAGRIYGLLAATFLLVVLLAENAAHYARLALLSEKLGSANDELEQLSLHDPLTGLANRRYFDEYLADQIAVARRHKRELGLIICDVDSFKAYNDDYGHQAGDEALRRVGLALQSCCRRPGDLAVRYGGEEFAMILPETGLSGALNVAETLRCAVTNMRLAHARSATGSVLSVSGGVAVMLGGMEVSAEELIRAADQSLYQAKRLGRNRMVPVATVKAA